MSATRMPPPQPAQRVGAAPKKSESPTPDDDGPSFTHQLHAWLENHRASLVDSLRRLGKQPIGSFFTCLVMAVALSLPMGLALLLDNVERLGVSWQRAAQISLFLQIDATDAQGQALREQIAAMDDVEEAEWISREQALAEFQQKTGENLAENQRLRKVIEYSIGKIGKWPQFEDITKALDAALKG